MFKSEVRGYTALRVSDRRDEESFSVLHGNDDDLKTKYFCRNLSNHETNMLWFISSGFFFWNPVDASEKYPDLPGVSYNHAELLAVTYDWGITGIRFKYSHSDESTVYSGENSPYAVDFEKNMVFEMRGPQYKFWSSRSQAVKTLCKKSSWWRPWSSNDQLIAKENMDRALLKLDME